jgi:type 2 lantibiotic biosynthesis protein LanM
MNNHLLQSSKWYHAINLRERIMSLGSEQHSALNGEVDINLAKKRMKDWKSQAPFSESSYFAQRLAIDNISKDKFLKLLGESVETIKSRFSTPPSWLSDFIQVFSKSPSFFKSIDLPKSISNDKRFMFLNIVEPLISAGLERLLQHINNNNLFQNQPDLPINPDTIERIIISNIVQPLKIMLSRTIVLELNVARLKGLLFGTTSKERFSNFLQRIRQRDVALNILHEYPVLLRQVKISIDNWEHFMRDFFEHLSTDWQNIQTIFSPKINPGRLIELAGGLGDTHCGGRSVLVAKFDSGFKLVYKPRSLSTDMSFQKLLTWLNNVGFQPPFRTLKILNRNTHGWVEFVDNLECNSIEDVHSFYKRQGGYLALLYALEATDFHSENIIATGEHPVLTDLETLFHPRLETINQMQSDSIAGNVLTTSVLHVGLLPIWFWLKNDYEGIDISGLAAKDGQLLPDRSLYEENVGTDYMHYARKRLKLPSSKNRPILNNCVVRVQDHIDSLLNGFTRMYRLILKCRGQLLSDNGPLDAFYDCDTRVVLRPTRVYSLLLYESFHPDLLHDALYRDRFFDKLWIGIKNHSHLLKVISSERDDLERNDIPIFTTKPNTCDIQDSCGRVIHNFFARSGMSCVKHRIQKLSKKDLEKQLWLIRSSVATLSSDTHHITGTYLNLKESKTPTNSELLLDFACKIGDRLEELAFYGKNDASWLGLSFVQNDRWSLSPLGLDLYSGLPGIALFLVNLSAITKNERYTKLAKATLKTIKRQIPLAKSNITSIGAFNGWGGIIYTFSHIGSIWGKQDIISKALDILNFLPNLIKQDEYFDIINGLAGCVGSLISLYSCTRTKVIFSLLTQCGELLIKKAHPEKQGIAWHVKNILSKPLAGFSHGNAGIAWSLLKLYKITARESFRSAALSAIDYERTLFVPEQGNWRDIRHISKNEFMTAWCHGAPGIGLSRLCTLQYLNNAKIRTEIEISIKTTLAQGFGANDSLCHGNLGNLEFLLKASEILKDPKLRKKVYCLAAMILENIERYGFRCGVPLNAETPGLMVGIAGMGYELLRLAFPERVPSILLLEPPITSHDISTNHS